MLRILSLLALLAGCASTTPQQRGAREEAPVPVTVIAAPTAAPTVKALSARPYLALGVRQMAAVLRPRATKARGDDPRQGARQALDRARQDYRKLRFAEAASALARAQADLAAAACNESDFDLLRRLALEQGISLLVLGKHSEAYEAFAIALRLGHQGPEPGQHPPEVEQKIRLVRDELAGAPRVGLTIKTEPGGCEVQVDGKARGRSPVTLQLAPGPHHVRIEQAGLKARAIFHSLAPGKSDQLEIFLKPLPVSELAVHLLARHDKGGRLTDLPPALLTRVFGSDVALLEVTGSDSRLQAHLVWTGAQRISPGACAAASPAALARCLGPLLHRLATGRDLPAAGGQPPAPLHRRWWFWTLVGAGAAATAGACLGIYYGTRDRGGTDVDIVSASRGK